MARRREVEVFSLSFLDAICCGFGAVIMLLVLTKASEPRIIEQSRVDRRELIAALQKELAEIRGEATVLDREAITVEEQLARDRAQLAQLTADLSRIRGQFAASELEGVDAAEAGALRAARQSLTDEMRRLLAQDTPAKPDAAIGGVPVDSEYVIFIIDTSGSMQQGAWPLVRRKMNEALGIYPRVKGMQVMSDNGDYLLPSYRGKWIPDSPGRRSQMLQALANWSPFSDSNPTDGIEQAIRTFYQPGLRISIYFLGDDFSGGKSVEAAIRYIERVNPPDATGRRLVRIHGIGFPVQLAGGNPRGFVRFANMMRALCERNGGSFVAVPEVAFDRGIDVRIGGPFPR